MDIRQALLDEHSKAQATRISDYIGFDQKRFDVLLNFFLKEEYRVAQRAAYSVMMCVDKHPKLVKKWLTKMIKNMGVEGQHVAIKRNTLRILQTIDLTEQQQGLAAQFAFKFVRDPNEPIAVRAFSMTVLHNITRYQPELKNELRLIVEDMMPYGGPAIKSRGRRILKDLSK